MQYSLITRLQRAVVLLAGLVIVKVTASVLWGYRDYLPANFEAEFLRGRQEYFFGPYQSAFFAHIAAGPITLLLGLVLISERFRLRFPQWHRSLGKLQALLILLLLAPSGFWMAWYSESGIIAALGFATLALATGTTVLLGWRAAVKGNSPSTSAGCCAAISCSARPSCSGSSAAPPPWPRSVAPGAIRWPPG